MKEKTIIVHADTHTQAKAQALKAGRTIKEYIKRLLDDDKERLG